MRFFRRIGITGTIYLCLFVFFNLNFHNFTTDFDIKSIEQFVKESYTYDYKTPTQNTFGFELTTMKPDEIKSRIDQNNKAIEETKSSSKLLSFHSVLEISPYGIAKVTETENGQEKTVNRLFEIDTNNGHINYFTDKGIAPFYLLFPRIVYQLLFVTIFSLVFTLIPFGFFTIRIDRRRKRRYLENKRVQERRRRDELEQRNLREQRILAENQQREQLLILENQRNEQLKKDEERIEVAKQITNEKYDDLTKAVSNMLDLFPFDLLASGIEPNIKTRPIYLNLDEKCEYLNTISMTELKLLTQKKADFSKKFLINPYGEAKDLGHFVEIAFKNTSASTQPVLKLLNTPKYHDLFKPLFDELDKRNIDFGSIADQTKRFVDNYDAFYLQSHLDLSNELKASENGKAGEERVNEELDLYRDVLINLPNIRLELEDTSTESDNIVITEKGIFLLEVKNLGEHKKDFTIRISKDGKWTKITNGHQEDMKDIASQINRHIGIQQRFLNNELKARAVKLPYLFFIPIIVIANNDIEIQNESDLTIIRVSNIYNYILRYKSDVSIDSEQREIIRNIFLEHKKPPKGYPITDYKEAIAQNAKYILDVLETFKDLVSVVPRYLDLLEEFDVYCDLTFLEEYHRTFLSTNRKP